MSLETPWGTRACRGGGRPRRMSEGTYLAILSLQDMVSSRSPCSTPSHVWTLALERTGMVPSPDSIFVRSCPRAFRFGCLSAGSKTETKCRILHRNIVSVYVPSYSIFFVEFLNVLFFVSCLYILSRLTGNRSMSSRATYSQMTAKSCMSSEF